MYCSWQSVCLFHVRFEAFKNVTILLCPALLDYEQLCVSDFTHVPVFIFFFGGELFPLHFICITRACFKLCVMINKGARSYLSQIKFSIYYLVYGPQEDLHNREVFSKTVLESIISCKSILIIIYENVNKNLGFFVSSLFGFCIFHVSKYCAAMGRLLIRCSWPIFAVSDVLLNNVKDHLSVKQSLKGYGQSYSTNISALPMEAN